MGFCPFSQLLQSLEKGLAFCDIRCYTIHEKYEDKEKWADAHFSLWYGKTLWNEDLDERKEGDRMTQREKYETRTQALLEPIIEENHLELVDVEYVKEGSNWYLRAYIDKEGGVSIDDCELVSRALSDLLDEEDFIPDAYILEVSSPGLGRPLKKEKDFARSNGKEVELRLYRAVDGQKEFTGVLTAYDDDSVTLDAEKKTLTFQRKEIALIRLAFDF